MNLLKFVGRFLKSRDMKEMMKNKPCFFILVVVAILSFIAGVVVGHAVFLLGDAEFVVGVCHVVMALTLAMLVVFLIKGRY